MREDFKKAMDTFEVKSFFMGKKSANMVQEILTDDESVLYVGTTNMKTGNANLRMRKTIAGVLCLTDKRIIFCSNIAGATTTELISLSDIEMISFNRDGSGGHIEVDILTKAYSFLTPGKQNIYDKIKDTFLKAKENASCSSSVHSEPDVLEQLERLAILKEKSILSQEEFDTKKAELLSKL